MSPQEILSLASQGDAKAIATLLHHSTKRKGITVRAKRQDSCLHVLLEGDRVPNQAAALSYVQQLLQILRVSMLDRAIVYGKQQGQTSPAWEATLSLQGNLQPVIIQPMLLEEEQDTLQDKNKDEDQTDNGIALTQFLPPADSSEDLPLLTTTPFDPAQHALNSQLNMDSSLPPSPQIPDFLKRPEAVALILCAIVLTLWDTYLALLNDLESLDSLSASQLAQRLGVETRQVRTNKRHEFFSEWTQSLDPAGIAWMYQNGVYVPKVS